MVHLELVQSLPHDLAERARLVPPHGDGLGGGRVECISALLGPLSCAGNEGKGRPKRHHWPREELRRLVLARAVVLVEVADNVGALVHLSASVGVHHVGELGLAPLFDDEGAVDLGLAGGGLEEDVEVEEGGGVAHLGAEGAALELIQLDGLGGPGEVGDDALLLEGVACSLEHCVLPLHVLLQRDTVALRKGAEPQGQREA
mmetsp:Transcript_20280/g.46806  ORF Transcript_20280/g.46806 Transcript_20280/m.46806 type:complete len:202 (-) Transcript_20280:276-881(-)